MTLDEFNTTWADLVRACRPHLADGGRLAFIIGPTEDGSTVVDHATEMTAACVKQKYRVERRIIVPYQTQQATGRQVEWARENKRMLKLYRDLVVMRLEKIV